MWFKVALFAMLSVFGSQETFAAHFVDKDHRALIAVVNLDLMASSQKHLLLYQWEQKNARNVLERLGERAYREVVVLDNADATRENFLSELTRLSNDEANEVVDVVFYLHGHSQKNHESPELCFVSDDKKCYPSSKLKEDLSGFTKLRALYSDACFGHEQNEDYIAAGFKVVAGSTDADTNQTLDLKRFFKKWSRGETFGSAIEYANKTKLGHLMDQVLKGDSTKIVAGDDGFTINSELIKATP
jgi:hypothetical protein